MTSLQKIFWTTVVVLAWSQAAAAADLPPRIAAALLQYYPPAVWHRGLETAHESLDRTKLRGFVTVRKEGIPAERARFFISWQEYDYRTALVENGQVTTRRGNVYAYVMPGTTMTVTAIESFGRNIYLRLITPDVYVPPEHGGDKRHARVTVRFGIRFPQEVFDRDDAATVVAAFADWLTPVAPPR